MDPGQFLGMGFEHIQGMDPQQLRDMGLEHLGSANPERLQAMDLQQLRAFFGVEDNGYWDSGPEEDVVDMGTLYLQDPEDGSDPIVSTEPPAEGPYRTFDVTRRAPGGRFRDEVSLRELLWAEGSARRALANRFRAFLRTLMDASAVAFAAANRLLNLHLLSNGRMLFELNEDNLARLLAFYFHETRDPNDVLFRGVSDSLNMAPARAEVPSWMRTAAIERRFAKKLRNAIERSLDSTAEQVFQFAADRRLEATGLREDTLPSPCRVWAEAVARHEVVESGNRDGFPTPDWSVHPAPELAPVLDRLYALYPRLVTGSLEDRLAAINATNAEAKDEVREGVKAAFAKARSLRAMAQRSRRNRTAARLAEVAEERARKLAAQEQACADIVFPFCVPPLSSPKIVLDCETLRDILISLDVPVPSLAECQADELGLFSRVFRIREFLARARARQGGRVRFDGVIDTDGETASVHCIFEGTEAAERRDAPRQNARDPVAEAPPGAGRGGRKPGHRRRRNRGRR